MCLPSVCCSGWFSSPSAGRRDPSLSGHVAVYESLLESLDVKTVIQERNTNPCSPFWTCHMWRKVSEAIKRWQKRFILKITLLIFQFYLSIIYIYICTHTYTHLPHFPSHKSRLTDDYCSSDSIFFLLNVYVLKRNISFMKLIPVRAL